MVLTVEELRKQIAEIEKLIEAGKGKDMSFEKSLVKSWKRYLPGGRYHYKMPPEATKSKTGRFMAKGRGKYE